MKVVHYRLRGSVLLLLALIYLHLKTGSFSLLDFQREITEAARWLRHPSSRRSAPRC